MRNLLFGLGLATILFSCSTSTTDVDLTENSDGEKVERVADVTPNRVLKLDIDGMVCKMGCGGSIRNELKTVEGIGDCNFDFEEDRETDIATIQFDKELISADEIVEIVTEVNDGQFTVGESTTTKIKSRKDDTVEVETSTESSDEEESTVTMSSGSGFQLPNLLEIFSSLLTS